MAQIQPKDSVANNIIVLWVVTILLLYKCDYRYSSSLEKRVTITTVAPGIINRRNDMSFATASRPWFDNNLSAAVWIHANYRSTRYYNNIMSLLLYLQFNGSIIYSE